MDLNKHKLAQTFDKYAKGYDEEAHMQYHVAEVLASYMHTAVVRDEIKIDKNFAMMDIGCGTGFCIQSVVHMLAVKGFLDDTAMPKVLGLDISEQMINECVQKFDEFKQHWTFAQIDFDEYVVDEQNQGAYDIITSSFSAHWMQSLEGFFEKSYELLKTGGVLAVALPVEGSLKEIREVNKTLETQQQLELLNFSSHEGVMTTMIKQGFVPKLYTRQGFAPSFLRAIDALKSMKNVGSSPPQTGVGGLKNLKTFIQKYDEMFLGKTVLKNEQNPDGVKAVALSYNVLFIIAQK